MKLDQIIKNKGVIFCFLLILYMVSRLYGLTSIPIFTDESIYIYWAKFIATNHSNWFLSLTDGKPPLLIWIISIFLTIFPADWYLIAGRLPSIIAGGISVVGIYKLTELLFQSKKTSAIASLLYIISPFALLYDRMALFDSLLSSMLIWSVYFAVKTAKTFHLKDAILWGVFLGLAFLSKPTAIIFLMLTPFCFLLFVPKKDLFTQKKKIFFLIFSAILVCLTIDNMQRVSSVYFQAAIKNQQFKQPISEVLSDPFKLTWGNLRGIFFWIQTYYTVPFFFVGMIAFLITAVKKIKAGILLTALWFLPIIIFAIVGRELFPRYVLFTTSYILIAIAYVLAMGLQSKKLVRLITLFVLSGILYLPLKFDYMLLTDPSKSPMPDMDYHQYIADHPSGYGLDVIFQFLSQESKNKKITIITQGTFGLYPYAFNLEYWNNSNITILGRWPLDKIDDDMRQIHKKETVYIILKEHEKIPENLPLQLILKGEKPGGRYPIFLTILKDQ